MEFDRNKYDTKEGITAFVKTYADFYEVMTKRREYGSTYNGSKGSYDPLDYLVLYGYVSDEYGLCWPLDPYKVTEHVRRKMSLIMNLSELEELVQKNSSGQFDPGVSFAELTLEAGEIDYGNFPFPSPSTICADCGKAWELADVSGMRFIVKYEAWPTHDYRNKTYAETVCLMKKEEENKSINTHRKIVCPSLIVAHGNSIKRVTPDYKIQNDDFIAVDIIKYYHRSCYEKMMMKEIGSRVHSVKCALEELAFVQVKTESAEMPEHIYQYLESEHGTNIAFRAQYFRITTQLGSFGIVFFDKIDERKWTTRFSVLDLKEAGVRVSQHERAPEWVIYLHHPRYQDDSELTFLRLWQALVLKKVPQLLNG